MNKQSLTLITLVVLSLLGFSYFYNQKNINQTTNQNIPEKNKSQITYKCLPGKSAFELLNDKSENVETKETSYGKMIVSINKISQGNGKYWLYSVDNKEATTSAEAYICQNNEEIKWELR